MDQQLQVSRRCGSPDLAQGFVVQIRPMEKSESRFHESLHTDRTGICRTADRPLRTVVTWVQRPWPGIGFQRFINQIGKTWGTRRRNLENTVSACHLDSSAACVWVRMQRSGGKPGLVVSLQVDV